MPTGGSRTDAADAADADGPSPQIAPNAELDEDSERAERSECSTWINEAAKTIDYISIFCIGQQKLHSGTILRSAAACLPAACLTTLMRTAVSDVRIVSPFGGGSGRSLVQGCSGISSIYLARRGHASACSTEIRAGLGETAAHNVGQPIGIN